MAATRRIEWWMLIGLALAGVSCASVAHDASCPEPPVPRELNKMSLPTYIIEPPDILLIDALRVVPRPPYHIEPLDALLIQVTGTLKEPIAGPYGVDPDGTVNLGSSYGLVEVAGLTIAEARNKIEAHLKKILTNPVVVVSLAQSRGMQQIRGEHLVRPDGTVGLGLYGSAYVAGKTMEQAKAEIEAQLSRFMERPEVSVDVFSYNSKVYYVITDGAGFGEQVYRFAITGNETVLDAVSQVYGLPAVATKKRIELVRPSPPDHCDQVLPVNWEALTQGGETATNYQVLPGDRIYVHSAPLITLDTYIARLFTPIERVLGLTLLGSATVHSIGAPFNQGAAGAGGLGVVR